jgi:hypothetical protein
MNKTTDRPRCACGCLLRQERASQYFKCPRCKKRVSVTELRTRSYCKSS